MKFGFLSNVSNKMRKIFYRIVFSGLIFLFVLVSGIHGFLEFALLILSFFVVGYDILVKAFRNILNLQVFDENFLMTVSTFGALYLGDYKEAVAIMLLYQIGDFFQSYAVGKSKKSIADLMDIRPDYANIEYNGKIKKVSPEKVSVGDIIIVKPGEKIPLDGIIIEGESSIDTSSLTGESMPQDVENNDAVMSGCINISGLLKIKVTKKFSESTVSKIFDLIENSVEKKANLENFITRFARYYTPIVVGIAVLLAFIPPLFFDAKFSEYIYRAVIFLVISCPCAFVISVPLSFFSGLGVASKYGILIKGGNYLEALSKAKCFVFEETGSISRGNFSVVSLIPIFISKKDLIEIAAYAEANSNHPIAKSIKMEYEKEIDISRIKNVKELRGFGVEANVDGKIIYAGNLKLMNKIDLFPDNIDDIGTVVYIATEGKYVGNIVVADKIKEDSFRAIKALKNFGVKKIVMLTGDKEEVARKIADKVCIDNFCSELLPIDKVSKVEELLKEKISDEKLVFVGDGINDAPVLARSDIGIAMGNIGSDAAIEASDIVIMGDELSKIGIGIDISKCTMKIVKENIIFALSAKFSILFLGLFGFASIWFAVFADVGVMIITVLNSVRMLSYKANLK